VSIDSLAKGVGAAEASASAQPGDLDDDGAGVGENIKNARLKAGLTQRELASELAVRQQAVGGWKAGAANRD
jgi:ribosome-binding protein aMBF1 (putative translation factor)